jgi:phosphate starvation-inducible PhoH-like protein
MQKFAVSVIAKNAEQRDLLRTISKNEIIFVRGIAGSGKTYLSIGYALQELSKEHYEKIILSRPVVEAGEKLGFLPGDMEEKINPYMLPFFYSMEQMLPGGEEVVKKLINKNGSNPKIRILPLAFMRGVTLKNSIILADEMQNSTSEQMRMLLTRIGEGSKMIICGDVRQSDLRAKNGLEHAFEILQGIEGIGFCTLTENAIVRHPIIAKIEEKYENWNKNKG